MAWKVYEKVKNVWLVNSLCDVQGAMNNVDYYLFNKGLSSTYENICSFFSKALNLSLYSR